MRYDRAFAISERHARLINLIRSGSYSTPSLAAELGVSEQTIYRDIDFLKQRGYSIRSEKLADAWAYRLMHEPVMTSNQEGAK